MTTWQDRMSAKPQRVPPLEVVAPCWRMRSPSGRLLHCAVYKTEVGLEVRAGYAEDLLHSQRVFNVDEGRRYAEELRQAVRAKGGFEELPVTGNGDSRDA
jgi:hypothetical protein